MKKYLFNALLPFFLLLTGFQLNAQSAGFNSSFARFNINGAALDSYYCMFSNTSCGSNPSLDGSNLGTFHKNSNYLKLKNPELNVYKCGGANITSTNFNYRIYSGGGGSYTVVSPGYTSEIINGCSGADQKWDSGSTNVNIANGLASGTYTFEAYCDAPSTVGTQFLSNLTANYKATFTITSNPVLLYSGTNVGAGTYYATLKAAFDAINAGTYTGALSIEVYDNSTETATAVLNASGAGSASYSTLSIKAAGGGARTITGSLGTTLIDLNGADNVTIDGVNASGNSLTINNTSTSATAGTIRFIGDATLNTIKNSTIIGVSTSTFSGTVFFSTGAAAGTGNDRNTISNNTITSGLTTATNAVFSAGTSTVIDNSGITISNNNIADYFTGNALTNGIFIVSNSSAWTITGNRFYQTATRTATGSSNEIKAILIKTASGGNYTINNNIIGFANSAGTGTTNYTGTVAFRTSGIDITTAAMPVSNIQGNTISGIAISNSVSGGSTNNPVFGGILVQSGGVNVGTTSGNIIGASTGTGSITVTGSNNPYFVNPIYATSSNNVTIQNNIIGSISATGTVAATGVTFTGITVAGSGSHTITNNTVGGSVANSISLGTLGTSTGLCSVVGIASSATGTLALGGGVGLGNTVKNITINAAAANIFNGISTTGANAGTTISYNNINGISFPSASSSSSFVGIKNGGAVTGPIVISNNALGSATANLVTFASATSVGSNAIQNTAGSATSTLNIDNNTVQGFSFTSSGVVAGIFNTLGYVGGNISISNNFFGTASRNFITYSAANSNALNIIRNAGGKASAALTISGNDFRGITHSIAGSSAHTYISNSAAVLNETISTNTFTNLNVNTTGTVYFINNSYTAPANGSKTIQNNSVVTGFVKTGAGSSFYGYYDYGSSNSTVTHTISGNDFSNVNVGANSGFGIYTLDFSGNPTLNIYNNTLNNWTIGAGIYSFYGIYGIGFSGTAGSPNQVYGNSISNLTSSSTALTQYGLYIGSTGLYVNAYNNTISNNAINGAGGQFIGIYAAGTSNLNKFYNNTITGLTSSSTSGLIGLFIGGGAQTDVYQNTINTFSSSSNVWGIYVNAGTTANIYQHQNNPSISANNYSLYGLSTSGSATVAQGIRIGGGTTANVYANNIYNLSNSFSGTVTGVVQGISLSSGVTNNVYNNTIGNLTAPNASSTDAIRGIDISVATANMSNKIYYNTVYLNATSSGTNFGTSGIYQIYDTTSTTAALDLRNNNIVNISTRKGTGLTVALRRSASTNLNNYNTNANNNNFYAGTPSASNLVYYDGTNSDQTLAAFQARVTARETDSVTENPPFVSIIGSDATFLHIGPTSSSILDKAAQPIATITVDYDGDPRDGTTPDIGADEFTLIPPANDAGITAIPLTGISCPGTNNVTVTLKNFGTATLTSARIDWKVNGVAQTPYSWTGSLATGATDATVVVGTYAFVGASSYVVSATSSLPNGVADGKTANDTFTTASFQTSLSGTYTVGVGKDFATITAAVLAANTNGLCGSTVFSLTDATYSGSETFPITINALTGSSATNTLTIKPAVGITPIISGSNANAIIKLNGADNIIIDGSNVLAGTTKNLTIINTSATGLTTLWIASTATDGATNNIIKNSIINGDSGTTTNADIIVSGSVAGLSAEVPNNNIIVKNNTLSKAQNGIFAIGNATTPDQNWEVSDNIIGSTITAEKGFRGIAVQYATNFSILRNTISGVLTSSISTSSGVLVGAFVTNGIISDNKISDVKNTNGIGYGSNGIYLNSSSTSANIAVYNNMIWDIASNGYGFGSNVGDNGYGIIITAGAGYKVYFNSVNMATNQITGNSAAINIASTVTVLGAIDLRNNIFANNQTANTRYAIYSAAANTVYSNIDYNDYFSTGSLGYLGTAQATIADWQTATSKDTNSLNLNPPFTSASDLHLSTCTSLESAGTPIAGITTDIDGDIRSLTTPDIGADEFAGTVPLKITSLTSGSSCGTGTVTLSAVGTTGTTQYLWYDAPTGGTLLDANSGTFTTPSISVTTTYYVAASDGSCIGDIRKAVVATVNPAPTTVSLTATSSPLTPATSCDLDYVKLDATGGIATVSPYSQNFDPGNDLSAISVTNGNRSAAWNVYAESFAGGNPNEIGLRGTGLSTATANWYLTFPAFNASSLSTLNLSFKHFLLQYGGTTYTRQLYLQTSTDGTTWSNVWTVSPTADISATTVNVDLSSLAGNSTVYFRFRFRGAAFGIDYWAIDDILINGDVQQPITWSPTTGLYTDAALTTPYVSGSATTVYASPETATTYTAKASLGLCDKIDTYNVPLTDKKNFTGNVSNNWDDAGNWLRGSVPTAAKCVNIPTGRTAIVNIDNAVAKTVTVASGGYLTINADKALKVTDVFTNSNASNLVTPVIGGIQKYYVTIESDGNLLQTNNVANVGDITAKRDLSLSTGRAQYNYLISPVKNLSLGSIYKNTDGTAVVVPTIFYYAENNNRFYASSGTYIEGRGLALKEPATSFAPTTLTSIFTGVPFNGSVSYTMVNSTPLNLVHGYNLIGNPYPSNIDLITFYTNNSSSNLDPTFYFWDSKANSQTTQAGSGYGGQAYATFNATTPPAQGTGTKATGDPGLAGLKEPTRFVKVGQGFIARSLVSSFSVNFDNTIRVKDSAPFFGKGAREAAPFDRYWLNLTSPTNITSNIAVVYFAGGNNDYTKDDSVSFGGSDAIYSIVGSEKVSINGKNTFANTDVVPLGSNHFVTGNYTISLSNEKDGIFANGQNIYLKDKQTGIVTNLSEGNYTFTANAGESTGRFEIVYQAEVVLSTGANTKENLIIYRDANDFVLKADSKKITDLEVFDSSGRMIYKMQPNNTKAIINADRLNNGVYVLKVNQSGEITSKKVIK